MYWTLKPYSIYLDLSELGPASAARFYFFLVVVVVVVVEGTAKANETKDDRFGELYRVSTGLRPHLRHCKRKIEETRSCPPLPSPPPPPPPSPRPVPPSSRQIAKLGKVRCKKK